MLDGVTTPAHSSGVELPDDTDELLDDDDDDASVRRGTTNPCVANPFFSAYPTRPASTSLIVTVLHPDCRAMAAVSKPTVPAPITRAVEPGAGLARFTAWMATDKGSRRAAASKDT